MMEYSWIRVPTRICQSGRFRVSKLGLGSSAFGAFYIQEAEVDVEEAKRVVEYAVHSGINYYDTAPWYGQGFGERIIGSVIGGDHNNARHSHGSSRAIPPRDSFLVSTKVGRYNPEVSEMVDFSYERTKQSIQTSLDNLQLDYVDFAFVHDPEFAVETNGGMDQIIHECLPALNELRNEGKVKAIGLTGYPIALHKELLELSKEKGITIDTCMIYSHYTLHDTSLLKELDYFEEEQDLTVFNAAAHSLGLLTEEGPPQWHPAHPEQKEAARKATEYCAEHNVSIGRLAAYFTYRTSDRIHTTLTSTVNLKVLKENVEICSEGFKLSEKEQSCLEYIRKEFFLPLVSGSWEGVEPAKYKAKLSAVRYA